MLIWWLNYECPLETEIKYAGLPDTYTPWMSGRLDSTSLTLLTCAFLTLSIKGQVIPSISSTMRIPVPLTLDTGLGSGSSGSKFPSISSTDTTLSSDLLRTHYQMAASKPTDSMSTVGHNLLSLKEPLRLLHALLRAVTLTTVDLIIGGLTIASE